MKTRPWITREDLLSPGDREADNAIMAASSVLFALSGQKFGGLFTTTEQYTCESTGAPVGCSWDAGERAYWNGALGAYTYVQRHLGGPRLSPGNDIRLQNRPVQQITSLVINGATVDPTKYALYNRAILRPAAGTTWGLCSSPAVTYEYGENPPVLGKIAARKLADEFVAAFNGEECHLPSSVTSVSRQGLSFSILDPQDFLEKGRVGIYEVDLFLQTVNPGRAKKRPRVFSPDLPRPYRKQ